MIQTGTYYTWAIKSDSVAVKHCDDDWINNYESVIPIEARPFLGVEHLGR